MRMGLSSFDDVFRGFEEMQRETDKELPSDANVETAKSKYNNGILEITFDKKIETKPKGKQIKIE